MKFGTRKQNQKFRKNKKNKKIKSSRKYKNLKSRRSGGGGIFEILYGNNSVDSESKFLSKEETADKPSIKIIKTTEYPLVMVMFDEDAPAKPSWLHWIVQINNQSDFSDIVPYTGPSPPSGTGRLNQDKYFHEYTFRLYKGSVTKEIPTADSREEFNIDAFVVANNLQQIDEQKSFKVYS